MASQPEDVNTLYRDDLKKRVEEMDRALKQASKEILELTQKVAHLETENSILRRDRHIKTQLMSEESFNDFIKELEEKEQPSCNLENPEDCEACGS